MKIISDIELDIPEDLGKEFLEKLMGGNLNQTLEDMLEDLGTECIRNIDPVIGYSIYSIDKIEDDTVFFESGDSFKGPNISKILDGSRKAAIFIITLGKVFDDFINSKKDDDDYLKTIVLDAISTSLLVILGKHNNDLLREIGVIKDGWASTCSYSPGQYKWTIEEQSKIFKMLDAEKIGVRLTESSLMIPFFSASGVYGFGPKDEIDKTRVACDLCPRENCIGRR